MRFRGDCARGSRPSSATAARASSTSCRRIGSVTTKRSRGLDRRQLVHARDLDDADSRRALRRPGGSTTETDGGRATIKLVAGKATNAELYYLAQPKGGTATVDAGRCGGHSRRYRGAMPSRPAVVERQRPSGAHGKARDQDRASRALVRHRPRERERRGGRQPRCGERQRQELRGERRRALADRARSSRRGSRDDHDRRERGRVAEPERSGHQGLSERTTRACSSRSARRGRMRRASSYRRPIKPRPRTTSIRRAR